MANTELLSNSDAATSTEGTPYAVESRGEDIFNSYGVEQEIGFLRRNRDKSEAELRYYLERNHVTFGTEFGAQLPYDDIPGVVSEDRLDVAGFDMLSSTRATAWLAEAQAGGSTRETYEAEAYARVHRSLMDAATQAKNEGRDIRTVRVASLSPAKHEETNYSFGFVFKITGELPPSSELPHGAFTFDEEILRYDEDFGSIDQSRQRYAQIKQMFEQEDESAYFSTDKDFLEAPIVYGSNEHLDNTMRSAIFGIDEEDIQFSKEFQGRVSRELQPLISGYTAVLLEMARGTLNESDPKVHAQLEELQDTIGQIYLYSKKIYEKMDEKRQLKLEQSEEPYVDVYARDAYMEYRRAKARGELRLEGGSFCPTVKGKSIFEINRDLSNGVSLESSIGEKKLCCTCPHCEKEVEAKISGGKIKCPECKAVAPYSESASESGGDDVADEFEELPLAA